MPNPLESFVDEVIGAESPAPQGEALSSFVDEVLGSQQPSQGNALESFVNSAIGIANKFMPPPSEPPRASDLLIEQAAKNAALRGPGTDEDDVDWRQYALDSLPGVHAPWEQAREQMRSERIGKSLQGVASALPGFTPGPEHAEQFEQQYKQWKQLRPAIETANNPEVLKDVNHSVAAMLDMTPQQRAAFREERFKNISAKGEMGIGEQLGQKAIEYRVPLLGTALGAKDLWDVKGSIEELQSGKELTPAKKEEHERRVLGFILKTDDMRARPTSIAGDIAAGAAELLPFAMEYMLSGGTVAAVKQGVKSQVGKYATSKLKEAGLKGVQFLAGESARAATYQAGRVAEEAARRQLGDVDLSPQGKVLVENAKGPAEAFAKAFGTVVIENISEASGGAIGKVVSKIPGAKPFADKLTKAIGETWVGKTGKTYADFLKSASTTTGFHGVLSEIGEERLGDTLRALTGVEDFGLKGDKNTVFNRLVASVPNGRQILTEFGTFMVPGAAHLAAAKAPKAISDAAGWVRENRDKAMAFLKGGRTSRQAAQAAGITENTGAEVRQQIFEEAKKLEAEAPPSVEAEAPKNDFFDISEAIIRRTTKVDESGNVKKGSFNYATALHKEMILGEPATRATIDETVQHIKADDSKGAYWIGLDVQNQKGLNKFFGESTVKADKEFGAPVAAALMEEFRKLDADIKFFKQGGDEWGILVRKHGEIDAAELRTAMDRANARVQQIMQEKGIPTDLENPRAPKPKYNRETLDEENRKIFDAEQENYLLARGAGVRFGIERVSASSTFDSLDAKVGEQHEAQKKGKGGDYGASGKAGQNRPTPPEGQPGGAAGGTGAAESEARRGGRGVRSPPGPVPGGRPAGQDAGGEGGDQKALERGGGEPAVKPPPSKKSFKLADRFKAKAAERGYGSEEDQQRAEEVVSELRTSPEFKALDSDQKAARLREVLDRIFPEIDAEFGERELARRESGEVEGEDAFLAAMESAGDRAKALIEDLAGLTRAEAIAALSDVSGAELKIAAEAFGVDPAAKNLRKLIADKFPEAPADVSAKLHSMGYDTEFTGGLNPTRYRARKGAWQSEWHPSWQSLYGQVLKERTDERTEQPDVVERAGPSGRAVAGEAGAPTEVGATEEAPGRIDTEGRPGAGAAGEAAPRNEPRGDIGARRPADDLPGEPGVHRRDDEAAEPRGGEDAGVVQGEDAGAGNERRGSDHTIEADDVIVVRGEVGRINANIKAIEISKQIAKENRPAFSEERRALAQYVGWGGLSEVFNEHRSYDDNWKKKYGRHQAILKGLLTEEEWDRAAASTRNAHYTSREIITKLWDMAKRLGFRGGTILEPAAGVGHFLGLMPKEFKGKRIAVELDTLTGGILKALYPQATVFNKGLEEVDIPPNSVDLAISNVPFDEIGPKADSQKRYGRELNLHNYFIARMIDAVRPGGLVIAISTRNTMDAQKEQREFLAGKSELIAAIRLPNDAFAANAGTEVTTDILVLRKPDGIVPLSRETWASTTEVQAIEKVPARINEYFARHPEMMLGKPSMAGKMRGDPTALKEFTLKPNDKPLAEQLSEALERLPENILSSQRAQAFDFSSLGQASGLRDGQLMLKDGKLAVVEGNKFVDPATIAPMMKSAKAQARAKDYIGLRDHYRSLIDLMLSDGATDKEVKAGQKKLGQLYDSYVGKHGPVNGKNTFNLFGFDPDVYLVAALEIPVKSTENGVKVVTYKKADVFTKRTISPRKAPASASSEADAVRISLAFRGQLDAKYVAELLGKTETQAKAALVKADLAFENPETGLWDTKEAYLSGNVRQKLKAAREQAERKKEFQRNVEALEKAQPAPVAAKDVAFDLGATWLPQDVVTAFARNLLDDDGSVRYSSAADAWSVTGFGYSAKNTETYGIAGKLKGSELIELALNLKQPNIYHEIETVNAQGEPTTKRVLDQKATVAAQAVTERIQAEFKQWVRKQEDLMQRIQDDYNEKFNFYVPPKYDGSHLELVGSSDTVHLRPYQKSAVWRFIQDGYGMLAHAVGAGKTYAMIATAMELRRMGLAKKPMLVVQNSTLSQFATAFRGFYPTANVLVATKKDLAKENRKRFLARIAANEYDAIVMAQSSFDLLPNDPQREADFINEQLEQLEAAIRDEQKKSGGGKKNKPPTVKELEKAKRALQQRLEAIQKKIAEREETLITFEELGVDALFVDEAHAYKKPPFVTKLDRITGLSRETSQRSFNVLMKLRHVQEKNKGRGTYLATGTPITNTLGEAWHTLSLVAPQLLKEFNVETFDRFVSTFASIQPTMEINAGGQWVQKQTLAKFKNGPEFIKLIHSAWDVVTSDELPNLLRDLNLDLPKLRGGKVQPVVVNLSKSVKAFTDFLRQIYAAYQKLDGEKKKELSYIPVLTYNAARAAALDIQLVYPLAKDDAGSKVNECVQRAAEIHKKTADKKSTQLIFSDSYNRVNLSKLKDFANGKNVSLEIEEGTEEEREDVEGDGFLYNKIVGKLVNAGVPRNEIAVITDYDTDAKRTALFDKVNSGEIRIVIGSTQKMGIGVNVQTKLVALHHLDTPWLPADLEQREGRILRFGNENAEVDIFSYGMEGTLDAAIYSKILRKAKFIRQVMAGRISGREFEDPAGALVLSAQEQQALLAGDARVLEKVELENATRTLRLEREGFEDNIARQRQRKKDEAAAIESRQRLIESGKKQAETLRFDEATVGQIGGKKVVGRKELSAALDAEMKDVEGEFKKIKHDPSGLTLLAIGRFGPLIISVHLSVGNRLITDDKGFLLTQHYSVIKPEMNFPGYSNLYQGTATTAQGIAAGVYGLADVEANRIQRLQNANTASAATIEELGELIQRPWDKETQLKEAEKRLEAVNEALLKVETKGEAEKAQEKADEGPEAEQLGSMGGGVLAERMPIREDELPGDKVPEQAKAPWPEIEARLAAAHGLKKAGLLERLKEVAAAAWSKATLPQEHLPNTGFLTWANEFFRLLKNVPQSVSDEISRTVASIIDPMGQRQQEVFARKVIVDNMLTALDRGEPLRFGFKSKEQVLEYRRQLDDVISKTPAIQKALETRKKVVREFVEKLVELDVLPKEALERTESYFHQMVLSRLQADRLGGGGARPQRIKRGFQKARVKDVEALGAEYDYNTSYIEAEASWMIEASIEMEKERMLRELGKRYDRLKELKADARARNRKLIDKALMADPAKAEAHEKIRKKIGAASAQLRELAKAGEVDLGRFQGMDIEALTSEEFFELANHIARAGRGDDVIPAKTLFKAIQQRRALEDELLGGKRVEWESLLNEHPDLDVWQPEPGNVFFKAFTIPEQIAEQLLRGLVEKGEIRAEQLREMTVMGPAKTQMVLPKEIVAQLEAAMKPAPKGAMAEVAASLMHSWKLWVLFRPSNWIPYFLRNLTGDLDPVLGAAPGIIPYTGRALDELYKYYRGNLALSEDLRQSRDGAVISSSLTAEEVPDLKELAVFKRFYASRESAASMGSLIDKIKRPQEFRENILRYAAFLYYKDKLKEGLLKNYGGSKTEVVDALQREMGDAVAAAHLARNLMGDYGNLSVMGNWIRAHAIPFWSWMEVNGRRYPRMILNASRQGKGKGVLVGGAVGALATAQIGLWYAVQWAWNNLMYPDDEEELTDFDRANPHILLGRREDGSIRALRNTGALGDFAEWFGLQDLLALYPKYQNGQISAGDVAREMLKAPVNKLAQGLRPDVKGAVEVVSGQSFFPDAFNPRTVSRRDAIAGAFAVRDEARAIQGALLKDGTRARPGYFERWLFAIIEPRKNALHEMYDLREAFLKKEGKESPAFRGTSAFSTMRDAATNGDYQAFLEAKAEYVKKGKAYSNFKASLKSLDPIASRLNDADEKKFEMEFLSGVQRQKLTVARDYSKELETTLFAWWKKSATEGGGEEKAEFEKQMKRDTALQAMRLSAPRPLKNTDLAEWKEGHGKAKQWFEDHAVDKEAARKALIDYMLNDEKGRIKTPELRQQRLQRLIHHFSASNSL